MIKPGSRVKILAIGKDDAYFYRKQDFIGKEGIVESGIHPLCCERAGFFYCKIVFNDGTRTSTFYRVKLKKPGKIQMNNKKRNHRILLEIYEVDSSVRVSELLKHIIDAVKIGRVSKHRNPNDLLFPSNFGKVIATNIPSYSRKESK